MAVSRVFSGARSVFKLNDNEVAFSTNVGGTEDVVYEPVRVLNSITVKEHVPVAYGVGMTSGRIRLIGDSLRNFPSNIFPRVGSGAADLLRNLLNLDDLVAQVQDIISGQAQFQVEGLKVAGHNWASAAGGLVGEDIAMVGILMREPPELQ